MLPKKQNLFIHQADPNGEERFIDLLSRPSFKLEQIVSYGQASAKDYWYDQAQDEWVVLLKGKAALEFAPDGILQLSAGDCLLIPAHTRHRVKMTSEDAVWLALHFKI